MIESHDTIVTRGLAKSFVVGDRRLDAVCGVDLRVRQGEIFGFLGPNGAGKTTTLRMLTTLLPIDAGEAWLAGVDVRRHPQEVRRRIGYVGQLGGADLPATGLENLLLQGQLYGLSKAQAVARADELIDSFELGEFVDRKVSSWSGGQRRRLEVALGLMHRPDVLFLDEPTTGLDPQNRANLWDLLRTLRSSGVTIFLTTHYLEEADALSNRLAIIDHGRIVAEGAPQDLKAQVAGETVVLRPGADGPPLDTLRQALSGEPFVAEVRVEGEALRLYVRDGTRNLPAIFQILDRLGVTLDTISLSQPSLDDVFLQRTGRALRDAGHPAEEVLAG